MKNISKMEKFDIVILLFILFGIYCAFNIRKDYNEYQKSKSLIDWSIFVRNLGVIFGSIIVIIYKIFEALGLI